MAFQGGAFQAVAFQQDTEGQSAQVAATTEAVVATFAASQSFVGAGNITAQDAVSNFFQEAEPSSATVAIQVSNATADFAASQIISGVVAATIEATALSVSARETLSGGIAITTGAASSQFSAVMAGNLLVSISHGRIALSGNNPSVVLTGYDSSPGEEVRVDVPDIQLVREPSRSIFVEIPPAVLAITGADVPTVTFNKFSRSKRVTIPQPPRTQFRGYAPSISIDYNDSIILSEIAAILQLMERQDKWNLGQTPS